MSSRYNHKLVEKKWQDLWSDKKIFQTSKNENGEKFYVLEMFPYPSGKILSTENLKVTSFCQEYKEPLWVNKKINEENNIKIENAILNKAKKLRLQSS